MSNDLCFLSATELRARIGRKEVSPVELVRTVLARAEADTILAQHPNHLLGLILAANAAHMRHDLAAERRYYDELASAAPAERAKQLPEYAEHANDITIALDARRP